MLTQFLPNPLRCAVAIIGILSFDRLIYACEDEHPPVISTPTKQFNIQSAQGNTIITLLVDPRGLGRIAPSDDDTKIWIDTGDPTGAWHYREWQWWKGHSWGDSCRPRYYAELQFQPRPQDSEAAAINYRIDGFDCRQLFLIPPIVEPGAPYWDVLTTIRNASGRDVEEYGQFFACYTPLNRKRSFCYWDESKRLVLFADRGVKHLDGYIANPGAYFLNQGAIPHCPRGDGRIVGRWHHPVIVSQASPAGWRSVLLFEAKYAASLAQGIEGGAMDYILFPSATTPTFSSGAEFTTHIRHVMLKSPELPTAERLDALWTEFERSHESIRRRAAKMKLAVGGDAPSVQM